MEIASIIVAQVLSILNGGFLVASMRCKNKDKFLILNSISNAFGFASMVVLKAYAAAIGPIVLTIQGIVSHLFEKKGIKQPKWMLPFYISLSILGGAMTVKSLLGILPVLSSAFASAMLMSKDMKTSRKIGLVSSSIALPYLVVNKAYVAALVFSSNFISTLQAIYKLDYNKTQNVDDEEKNIIVEEQSSDKQEELKLERKQEDVNQKIITKDNNIVYSQNKPLTRKRTRK